MSNVLFHSWYGSRSKPVTDRRLEELGYGYDEDGEPVLLHGRHRHRFTPEPAELPEVEEEPTKWDKVTIEQAAGLCACYDQGMPAHKAGEVLGLTETTVRKYYQLRSLEIATGVQRAG